MKKLILIILIAVSYEGISQDVRGRRVIADQGLFPGVYDTLTAPGRIGEQRVRIQDTSLYMAIKVTAGGKRWVKLSKITDVAAEVDPLIGRQDNDGLSLMLNADYTPTEIAAATFNNGKYNAFGSIGVFPNGEFVMTYKEGADHIGTNGNTLLKLKKSKDKGRTWSTATTIQSDASYVLSEAMGGVTPSGRLIVFYMRYNSTTGLAVDMKYIYSDDYGVTFSAPLTLNHGAEAGFEVYGSTIAIDSGKILQGWYGVSGANKTIYAAISSDNGLTWSSKQVVTSTAGYYEPSYVYLGGGYILGMFRNDDALFYRQVLSSDNGHTWTDVGQVTFDQAALNPPFLSSYVSPSGKRVVECYYNNNPASSDLKVVYGYATDLITNGVNGWDANTRTVIASGTGGRYPVVVHPYGNPKGIGWYYTDSAVGFNGTYTNIHYFVTPSTHSTPINTSGYYILNQTTQQASANINVSGSIVAGTSISTPSLNLPLGIGTNRDLKLIPVNSESDNVAISGFYPISGTNAASIVHITPKGTGNPAVKSQQTLWNTDYNASSTNYEGIYLRTAGTSYSIASLHGGTGVTRPIFINATGSETGATSNVYFHTNGRTSFNTTTDFGYNVYVNGTFKASTSIESPTAAFTSSANSSFMSVGATPASSGAVRLTTGEAIKWGTAALLQANFETGFADITSSAQSGNTAMVYNIVPKGTPAVSLFGIGDYKTGFNLWGTEYALDVNNYSRMIVANGSTAHGFISSKSGTGTFKPFRFVTYNDATGTVTEVFKINTDGGVTAGKYFVSALNTAPSSATDTGTTGEIRITADFIYIAVGTNQWKRVAISTW